MSLPPHLLPYLPVRHFSVLRLFLCLLCFLWPTESLIAPEQLGTTVLRSFPRIAGTARTCSGLPLPGSRPQTPDFRLPITGPSPPSAPPRLCGRLLLIFFLIFLSDIFLSSASSLCLLCFLWPTESLIAPEQLGTTVLHLPPIRGISTNFRPNLHSSPISCLQPFACPKKSKKSLPPYCNHLSGGRK